MKTTIIFFLAPLFMIITSCKTENKSNNANVKELVVHEESFQKDTRLILNENTFGKLKLEKGMPLLEPKLKEVFNDFSVTKNVGEQDGPNYYYYEIGTEAILTTPDTENVTLSQLWIHEKSSVFDVYGIKLGMTYTEINEKRPTMDIKTEHSHIYLYKKGSNIAYEMSLGNYNGPDKEAYSIDDIMQANSKVISIIWK